MSDKSHTERWAYTRLYRGNVFELATRLTRWVGRRGAQWVSRSVAAYYAHTQPAVCEVVRKNLCLLREEPFTTADARSVFRNIATTLADYVAVANMSPAQAMSLCTEHVGLEHLADATRGGRGVVLATGHYGFFEFGAVILSQLGHAVTVATLPEPSDALTQWRADWRSRWNTQTIPVGADPFSSLQVIRAIESGRCMAMLADRPIGERGIVVDLPNGRIPFSISPALLSWMTGCAVLPVLVSRLPGGGYRVTACPPVTARRGTHDNRNAEIARCTREIAAALVGEIRRNPLEWFQFVPVSA